MIDREPCSLIAELGQGLVGDSLYTLQLGKKYSRYLLLSPSIRGRRFQILYVSCDILQY